MPKQPPPSAIADKFMLRLPDGMRDRIAKEAKSNNRSMNAEIVARLEASLSQATNSRLTDEEKEDLWQFIHKKLDGDKR